MCEHAQLCQPALMVNLKQINRHHVPGILSIGVRIPIHNVLQRHDSLFCTLFVRRKCQIGRTGYWSLGYSRAMNPDGLRQKFKAAVLQSIVE